MLRLKLDGHSYQHIGELAGISRQRVQQLLSPPAAVRRIVVNAYNGRCANCGIHVGYTGHVHHKGQEAESYNHIEQLELLCPTCHRVKHPGPPLPSRGDHPATHIELIKLSCLRCGHIWIPKKEEIRQCPRCKSAYWDKAK